MATTQDGHPLTPTTAGGFTLTLKYQVKPGLKPALLAELTTILDLCAREPEFVAAVLNENPERPDELQLFEIWRGTPEGFRRAQGPKPYRRAYLEHSRPLVERVEVSFLQPIGGWGTDLLTR
jgi:hypothetical protein